LQVFSQLFFGEAGFAKGGVNVPADIQNLTLKIVP
jgi:hypothetical protein